MSSLCEAALRIFLANALYEAETLLSAYESQNEALRTFRPSVGDRVPLSSLDQVVTAARKVVSYIRNCLCHEGSVRLLSYGFSAIGAAQEALVFALASYNSRPVTDKAHYMNLNTEHTLRAKFIVNSLIASIAQDHELASLWVLASKEMHQRSELKCIGNTNDTSIPKSIMELTQQHLRKAVPADTDDGVEIGAEEAELLQLVARHYRLAAVCTVLRRDHMHHYAAKTYKYAASLSRDAVTDGTPETLKLWQTAVSTMRLAGDMVTVHTDESSVKNDALITQTINMANQLASDARRVPTFVAVLEEWKRKVDASRAAVHACKNPFLTPVLQLLLEKYERVHLGCEKYLEAVLQCESQAPAAIEFQRGATSAGTEASDLEHVVKKLNIIIQDAQCYRMRAVKAFNASHKEVKLLLRECWTKAADLADHILQLTEDLVKESIVQSLEHDLSGVWQRRYEIVRSYAYIAENVLGCAVEYLNKARGAEAGEINGRDPREAQMWRKAAECRVQTATLMYTALSDCQNVSTARISLTDLLQLSIQPSEQAEKYALVADYLSRSDKYWQLLDVEAHAQRVSDLYEKLASLTIQKHGLNTNSTPCALSTVMFEDSVLSFTFKFIELLNSSTLITPGQIALYERGCEYGHKYLMTTYATNDSDTLWRDAFEYCFSARNLFQPVPNGSKSPSKDVTHELAVAAVYALGAAAADQGRKYFGLACARAARVTNRYMKVESFKMYHFVLAERIIVLADSTDPNGSIRTEPLVLPAELLQLLPEVVNDDPVYQDILQEHAGACCLEVECEYRDLLARASKTFENPWIEAKQEVSNWIYYLELRAKHYHDTVKPTTDDTSLLAFHKLSVSCYIAAARHTGNSALSMAWKAAVDMCKHVTIGHIDTATTAIQRIVRAARAVESGDEELGAVWRKASSTARIVHERTISRSASIEAAYCEFKQAECNAVAFVALREDRKRVSALWKKAALKWKEAIPLCPLTFVDTQQHKVKVKLEALRKMKVEAEKLEKMAETEAQKPAEERETEDVADSLDEISSSSALPPLTSATVTTIRSAALPAQVSITSVRPISSAARSRVAGMSASSHSTSRPTSAQQNPSRQGGDSKSARSALPRRVGAGTHVTAVATPARPLSSRSTTGASSSRTTATSSPNSSTSAAGGAVKTTSARK